MFDVAMVRLGYKRMRGPRGSAQGITPMVRTLADMRDGETARIACVQCSQAARCERLMAYGLAQGQWVTLVQSRPAFVVRVDETELALDTEVARCIQVEPRWPPDVP
jgi:Fe2+ transport system protein FeoA